MKFIKPNAAPANDGGSGIPSWKRKWIENQIRSVMLECGHIEDLNANGITLINSFDGCEIDCITCGRFVKVKKPLKRQYNTDTVPDQPLF